MKYIKYKTNGQIISTGECPAESFSIQVQTGELIIEGSADDELHYIVGGVVTLLPAKPSKYHTFNYATETWSDVRTTEQVADSTRSTRAGLYPSVAAQLEAIWKAMDDNVLPRVEPRPERATALQHQHLADRVGPGFASGGLGDHGAAADSGKSGFTAG